MKQSIHNKKKPENTGRGGLQIKNKHGVFRVEWAEKFIPRSRRLDQRVIDVLVLNGDIYDTEYQVAEWYYGLAVTSIRMSNMVSNLNSEKVSGGNNYMSSKQIDAIQKIRSVDKFVENKFKDKVSILRNSVIYDEPIDKSSTCILKDILNYILNNQSKWQR